MISGSVVLWLAVNLFTAEALDPCPLTVQSPNSTREVGIWYLQYSTPLAYTQDCNFLNTVEPCRCIIDSLVVDVIEGQELHFTQHVGFNDELMQWQLNKSSITHEYRGFYKLTVFGVDPPLVITVTAYDPVKEWILIESCFEMQDISGKMVSPYWLWSRKENPDEATVAAMLASLRPGYELYKIDHTRCP